MQSLNKKPMTVAEREHVDRIKSMSCSLTGAPPPSEAHEIEQGQWFTAIPLSIEAHRGPDGLHGTQRLFRIYKTTPLECLNRTIGMLMGVIYSPQRRVTPTRERTSKLTRPDKIVPRDFLKGQQ